MSDTTEPKQTNEYKTIETWDELPCDANILRGIYAYGFENPSPIQKKAIMPMTDKRDIIAQAQSGNGKTGCFTIGTLANIDTSKSEVQAMILSPTRELSQQTKSVIDALGSFMKGLKKIDSDLVCLDGKTVKGFTCEQGYPLHILTAFKGKKMK